KTPATIVMLIDDSQGADAMLSYKKALPDLGAMNRKDVKIVLVPDSPSEMLARVVRSQFLDQLPKESIVRVSPEGGIDEVIKGLKEVGENEPQAFVLWEPFVSRMLQETGNKAHVLVDSSQMRGQIVDVLVVQKEFLAKNPDKVKTIVKAYLESA